MSDACYAGASDDLAVTVTAGHGEWAAVKTDFRVDRWDAEATAWAHRYHHLPEAVTLKPHHFATAGRGGILPYQTTVDENCNMVVLGGWAALLGGISGSVVTHPFSSTFGRIGVGTSSTASAATQTSLLGDTGSGSTTSYYQVCGAAPTISTAAAPATMVFAASFGNSVANFAWNEFGTDNYNTSGVTAQGLSNVVFVNRGVSAQGTKASGQTWTATETISFGFPSGSGAVS